MNLQNWANTVPRLNLLNIEMMNALFSLQSVRNMSACTWLHDITLLQSLNSSVHGARQDETKKHIPVKHGNPEVYFLGPINLTGYCHIKMHTYLSSKDENLDLYNSTFKIWIESQTVK